ncbi:unnamed protein product [Tilletia controversa]|nr:unnamed protein product [Tilletia controversa]
MRTYSFHDDPATAAAASSARRRGRRYASQDTGTSMLAASERQQLGQHHQHQQHTACQRWSTSTTNSTNRRRSARTLRPSSSSSHRTASRRRPISHPLQGAAAALRAEVEEELYAADDRTLALQTQIRASSGGTSIDSLSTPWICRSPLLHPRRRPRLFRSRFRSRPSLQARYPQVLCPIRRRLNPSRCRIDSNDIKSTQNNPDEPSTSPPHPWRSSPFLPSKPVLGTTLAISLLWTYGCILTLLQWQMRHHSKQRSGGNGRFSAFSYSDEDRQWMGEYYDPMYPELFEHPPSAAAAMATMGSGGLGEPWMGRTLADALRFLAQSIR